MSVAIYSPCGKERVLKWSPKENYLSWNKTLNMRLSPTALDTGPLSTTFPAQLHLQEGKQLPGSHLRMSASHLLPDAPSFTTAWERKCNANTDGFYENNTEDAVNIAHWLVSKYFTQYSLTHHFQATLLIYKGKKKRTQTVPDHASCKSKNLGENKGA